MFFWIFFGALAGWVASMITGTNDRQGCLIDIVVGIVGAFLGGLIMQLITRRPFTFGWDPTSFVVAVAGAIVLLLVISLFRRTTRRL